MAAYTINGSSIRAEDANGGFLEINLLDYAQFISSGSYKDYLVFSISGALRSMALTSWGGIGNYSGCKEHPGYHEARVVFDSKISKGYIRKNMNLAAQRSSIAVKLFAALGHHSVGSSQLLPAMKDAIGEWVKQASDSSRKAESAVLLRPEVMARRMTNLKCYLSMVDDKPVRDALQRIASLSTPEERAKEFSRIGFGDFDGALFDGWKALHALWSDGNKSAKAMVATVVRSNDNAGRYVRDLRLYGVMTLDSYVEFMLIAGKVTEKMPWEA